MEVFLTCLLIFFARIGDVSIGTIRTVAVMRGQRLFSWVLGFFEILIWVFAVSQVINNLGHPAYAIAYALGFATGNYVGLTIERWLALGRQVVEAFTRLGPQLAAALRARGVRVTQFVGEGRDGAVYLLYIEIGRRQTEDVIKEVLAIDPQCFYVVGDIRYSSVTQSEMRSGGWRWSLKKK
jgi:uncharacterized protein YebE (UPF0316 family)